MAAQIVFSQVAVAVSGGPGSPRDFVGLFVVGAANTAYLSWGYLASDNHVRPSRGKTAATVHLSYPTNSGDYEARLLTLAADGTTFQAIATTAPFHAGSVAPPPPTASLSFSPANPTIQDTAAPGTQVTSVGVTMSDGSQFGGTLSLSDPKGIFALSGSNIVTARVMSAADRGTDTITVTANDPAKALATASFGFSRA